jgi:replicative DNA helicase
MSADKMEKPLPHDPEAEKTILACGILDANSIPLIAQQVSENDFFLEKNRKIFLAQKHLAAAGQPTELVALCDCLKRRGDLEYVGADYVASLVDGAVRVRNVQHYTGIIREKALGRSMIHLCHNLEEKLFGDEAIPHKLLESGTKDFLGLLSRDGDAALPSSWREAVMLAMEEITQSIRKPGSVMRLRFGLRDLDEVTSGFRRQDLVLVVGQTGHGKTTLVMELAANSDSCGYKGLIFSAEMSRENLAKREIAHTAKIPQYFIRRPELIHNPDSVLEILTEAAATETKRKLTVVDQGITPERVWAFTELTHRTSGLDFVIVDYDQLVVRAGLRRNEDEFAEQAKFVATALDVAKRLNICFILLCQPRKVDADVARGQRIPRIEDIFGSSAVANAAHHVLWIVRHFFQKGMDVQYERDATAYILKARNDNARGVELEFDPDAVLFKDKQKAEQEETDDTKALAAGDRGHE